MGFSRLTITPRFVPHEAESFFYPLSIAQLTTSLSTIHHLVSRISHPVSLIPISSFPPISITTVFTTKFALLKKRVYIGGIIISGGGFHPSLF